ncbi:MAG: hypothetical protein ABSF23_01315 [Terracidiphilus sp.]
MRRVACDDGEVVQECNGSNLLVDAVLLVCANEDSPNLGRFQIERQKMLGKLGEHRSVPLLKSLRLGMVAPLPQALDAAFYFACDLHRHKNFVLCVMEEFHHPGIGFPPLSSFTENVGIDKIHT